MKRSTVWLAAAFALGAAILVCLAFVAPAALLIVAIPLRSRFAAGLPPIAKGVITKEDWGHFDVAGRKLTEALEATFPIGSREDALRTALVGHGFRDQDPRAVGLRSAGSAGGRRGAVSPVPDIRADR